MAHRDPGPIPNRWLNCPRKSTTLIAKKFVAFKTPLGNQFNDKVPEGNRFTPSMLFDYIKNSLKMKLGLWIDLTNTDRFYDRREIEKMDCKYVKLSCRGHGETPTPEKTREFINLVAKFISQHPQEIIGVHCTHGFNRTGFMLVSFMVDQLDCSLGGALAEFSNGRHPGIYKQDYIDELSKIYYDEDFKPVAPPRPDWCNEEEEEFDDEEVPSNSQASQSSRTHKKSKKGKKERVITKTTFMPGIHGVEPLHTQPRLSEVQKLVQSYCKWDSTGFPGSQPVSMDLENISKLSMMPYRVSWKADGVRYMMLIEDKDKVYMIDRDNCVFQVHGLTFLHNTEKRHLKKTLLDGEMVVDTEHGENKHRFLCYDIIRFEDMNVGKEAFYPVRLTCLDKEIIRPRTRAIEEGLIKKEREPFRVVLKYFWDVTMTEQLLGEKFAKTLHHEPDGLIFQPSKEPYVPGPCEDVLKWKPGHMNSVDFLLKIAVESGPGILPRKVGQLYVGSQSVPFAHLRMTKSIKHLHNKIIECKFENNEWMFMRQRTDKSYPNSYSTAMCTY
ncbi:unnamed protein product [Leptidea sinapis]|uniref:mRNA-capping enzyme n=1 Tax=Leptidea sinapis TaxID=189913 RepID=A0A5E4Q7D3_9NEOP|nr:unnamed protein product [Leptidea sinapis]